MKLHFVVLITLAVVAVSQTASIEEPEAREEWNNFKLRHSKTYRSSAEDNHRMSVFMQNKQKIEDHNENLYSTGKASFKLGMNKYGDMTHEEFVDEMNGISQLAAFLALLLNLKPTETPITYMEPANVEFPEFVDWRTTGCVTPVKDQGQCGSCWAFSTTGALEGQHFRKTGQLISLSEQNLMDCSTDYMNFGCNGGMMDRAYQYIKDNGGIDTEESYPYEEQDVDTCRYTDEIVRGFVGIPQGDENSLKSAIATVGPISIAIDASHESFQFYQSGVYYEPACSSVELDHAVLAVGYGTDENGDDYYLTKNSWGTTWGEQGYIKMARNKNNACGYATQASYPLV